MKAVVFVALSAILACSSSSSTGSSSSAAKTCADLDKCCANLSDPAKSACTAAVGGKNDQACDAFYGKTCNVDGGSADASTDVWCDIKQPGSAGAHYCSQVSDDQTCQRLGGTTVSACSTSGLLGSCNVGGAVTYYYSDGGQSLDMVKGACTSSGGTWQ